MAGAAERMRNLVSQELDVVVSVKEAKQSREQLIKDRTVMGKELAELKRKQRVTMTNTEREQMSKRISELEDEMKLRNTQISDLQNQLMGKSYRTIFYIVCSTLLENSVIYVLGNQYYSPFIAQ